MNHFDHGTIQLFISYRSKHLELVSQSEIKLKNESFQPRYCSTVRLLQKQTCKVSLTVKDQTKNE